jgi:TonB family protein
VEVETCKVVVIRLHWDEGGDTSYPVQALEDLMQRLPEVRRTAFTPELEAIRQSLRRNRSRLVADIAECQSSPDISTSSAAGRMATLGDRYLELQGRLAVAIDAAVEAGESKPLQQQRSTPCPAPAVPGPGDTKIRYHTRANAADYYPAHARNLELEGIARMGVVYDSGGCILKAYVLRTAGSQLLDEAAMRMVFDMQLVPALQDGKPAAGEVVIPVNFHLRSE